ncbi:MAG: hypothetical protein M3362_04770 [Acidobacteriota bacterium]|nr:hypothetical protein [Acidobacteriota bacterium]
MSEIRGRYIKLLGQDVNRYFAAVMTFYPLDGFVSSRVHSFPVEKQMSAREIETVRGSTSGLADLVIYSREVEYVAISESSELVRAEYSYYENRREGSICRASKKFPIK